LYGITDAQMYSTNFPYLPYVDKRADTTDETCFKPFKILVKIGNK